MTSRDHTTRPWRILSVFDLMKRSATGWEYDDGAAAEGRRERGSYIVREGGGGFKVGWESCTVRGMCSFQGSCMLGGLLGVELSLMTPYDYTLRRLIPKPIRNHHKPPKPSPISNIYLHNQSQNPQCAQPPCPY